jgi:pimeloyl-ACP methyl ester carboxylesterase
VPAFFVHGVPDTAALWDGVRANLDGPEVIAPNLPGFDAPLPAGFGATKEEYVAWVIGELERVGEPVDLVGHDWGSLIVQRVVSLRPELVRTWAAGAATVDREYAWHEAALMWQTAGIGEQIMDAMTPDAIVEGMADQLGGRERARAVASRVDETMKDCILRLYRSAVHVFDEWHDAVDEVLPTRPGLVCWGADDPFVTEEFGRRLADRTQARLVLFPDTGHWWPATRPAETAAALGQLWSVPNSPI